MVSLGAHLFVPCTRHCTKEIKPIPSSTHNSPYYLRILKEHRMSVSPHLQRTQETIRKEANKYIYASREPYGWILLPSSWQMAQNDSFSSLCTSVINRGGLRDLSRNWKRQTRKNSRCLRLCNRGMSLWSHAPRDLASFVNICHSQ